MGRDPKYDPSYCNQLIAHMEDGFSIESFAGTINVCRKTLYNWFEAYEEFREAKDIAMMKSLYYWEKLGMEGIKGEKPGFKSTPYIFTVKNRFPDLYKDKKELDVSSRSVMSFQEGIDHVHDSLKANPDLLKKIEEELIDE